VAIATSWQSGRGPELEPVERDMETWDRVTSVLDRATPSLLS
jgi:xylulokinase